MVMQIYGNQSQRTRILPIAWRLLNVKLVQNNVLF